MVASELAKQIGDVLTSYMKTGPQSEAHAGKILNIAAATVAQSIVGHEEATERYRQVCDRFLARVISSKGLPLHEVPGGGEAVSSNEGISDQGFTLLLPLIQAQHRFCVENFHRQAAKCLSDELDQFRNQVGEFLKLVPSGGSKDKELKAQITGIKRSLRFLTKWHELLYTYKAISFPAEVEYIFSIQDAPIAARWSFSSLDDHCEFQKDHDHRAQHGVVYLVRNSWAMEKGYLDKDSTPYIEDVVRPKQEIGCMCTLTWLHNLRDLPGHLLSSYGQEVFDQTKVR